MIYDLHAIIQNKYWYKKVSSTSAVLENKCKKTVFLQHATKKTLKTLGVIGWYFPKLFLNYKISYVHVYELIIILSHIAKK